MGHRVDTIVRGNRILFPDGTLAPGTIFIQSGKIAAVRHDIVSELESVYTRVIEAGDKVVMPGVVDSHVHINEPGRTDWEGFYTATRAAAAGGCTTVGEMPLNSIPATTSLKSLKVKQEAARGQCYVDIAYWGGIVPGNAGELRQMLRAGVPGFKCFLVPSGVPEFEHVQEADLHVAFRELQGTGTVVLFHAEKDCACAGGKGVQSEVAGAGSYDTFLKSRPDQMEVEGVRLVCRLCLQYNVRCHIVHLSSVEALTDIISARQQGAPLTVETCHHYLNITAAQVPEGATQFKCCPPIREQQNQDALWDALKAGHIDMVVSDHSPCTPDLKLQGGGDFMQAWGGISSVQFGLSLLWTSGRERGLSLGDVQRLMCVQTAKLLGLQHTKGLIAPAYDADLIIWDPEATWKVQFGDILHKNKLTPYLERELRGVVHLTMVRGWTVYDHGEFVSPAIGGVAEPSSTPSSSRPPMGDAAKSAL